MKRPEAGAVALAGHDADDRRLGALVQRMIERQLGGPAAVRLVERRPSRFATLFPAEVLTIEIDGGERTSLFLKHLGAEEQRDHPEKRCREREVRIYERLLVDRSLPVARFYGAEWNAASRRFELFLEYVDDLTLNYQGFEHWLEAARRLAHLHALFADHARTLLDCEFLLRLDARHFMEWADRALAVVGARSADLAAKLGRIVDRYDPVVALLAAQPLTLVHNDLSPKNVIADRSRSPARICFVDWEMAGIGCGVIDIVHLAYGLDERDDRKLRSVYCEELAGTDLVPAGRQERGSIFAACELHRVLHRLAHIDYWNTPLERVERWVADVHRLRTAV
jgi:thiamine kinase-like enzyme